MARKEVLDALDAQKAKAEAEAAVAAKNSAKAQDDERARAAKLAALLLIIRADLGTYVPRLADAALLTPEKTHFQYNNGGIPYKSLLSLWCRKPGEGAQHSRVLTIARQGAADFVRVFVAVGRDLSFETQFNEVLCKVLCHNLAVLAHEMRELGVEPTFKTRPVAA